MKQTILTATLALAGLIMPLATASAQTASFVYNDGSGTGNAGSYTPGSSFSFSINLVFTPGQTGAGPNIQNLNGLSYYFTQQNINPPFNFAITLRDLTTSPFGDAQTPGIAYPQALSPINANDLGALSTNPMLAGTYFVANLSISISASAAPGTYLISNTTSGGRNSVITDSDGETLGIPASFYTITVVPEPSTYALLGISVAALAGLAYRRRFAAR